MQKNLKPSNSKLNVKDEDILSFREIAGSRKSIVLPAKARDNIDCNNYRCAPY